MNDTIRLAKRIVALSVIFEYTAREYAPTDRVMKQNIRNLLSASQAIQNFYIYHPQQPPEGLVALRQELLGDNLVMMGPLIDVALGYDGDTLEAVTAQLAEGVEIKETDPEG